jgi:hypothetical protein
MRPPRSLVTSRESFYRRQKHHGDQNAQCDVIEGVSENVHGVVPASSPR